MQYIQDCDLDYILNKYHDTKKPFDSFQRFVRHDEIFDPASGMDADEICAEILRRDAEIAAEPHSIRKAHAFAFVLEKTRLDVNAHDYFPAINCIDRPLRKTLVNRWNAEVFNDTIPEINAEMNRLRACGAATIWADFDHSVPYWDRLFALGFPGILAEAEQARRAHEPLSSAQRAYFDAIRITYEAILAFIRRLRARAEATPSEKGETMRRALVSLEQGAPQSLYEGLLMIYLYFICSEHIEPLQVRSLSNLDRMLYPLYRRDLETGACAEEDERAFIAYFLLQFTAIGNYWGQPVYLAGTQADGSSEVNELTYLILDVYDRMGIYNPKIHIKLAPNTPEAFVKKALDMIRRGHNSIVFVCERTMIKALTDRGVPYDEARLCDVKGCYEYLQRGALDTCTNYVSMIKPLEFALHNGCDGVTGEQIGPQTGTEFPDFAAFYAAYKAQLRWLIGETLRIVNAFEPYLVQINPQPLLDATFPASLAQAKDVYEGGTACNVTSMSLGYVANVADSLTAIKKYVYDRRELTLDQLRDALDHNWQGYEKLRLRILADRDKYGNNHDLPDSFAKEVAEYAASLVNGQKNTPARGGFWWAGLHMARQSYDQGANTLATPDGRLTGTELSKNGSASMGQNREGATAAILSLTKLDATLFPADAVLDAAMLLASVRGEDGLEAMYGLLKTFEARGGHGIHFNVFNAEKLREAQKHPEQFADLQIRVCGWNVLFNSINKEEQDGFIRQAESAQ